MAFSTDTSNHLFQLAVRFVNQTNRHIFLTGKAGTGKTTFLKYIRENTFKKLAIVAPTGVAAINAGGVTMHSFFQLPHGSFLPVQPSGWNSHSAFNTPHTLLAGLRLTNDKKVLLQELELLIIDEVSMLRADILDEIDCILRHVRRKQYEPFGGVQMLYIGDLFQLPPVVKNEEWDQLKHQYNSPFFFDAQALQQKPPLYLELKKIYRQHEQEFIGVLNNIRNNKVTATDLDLLHQHYLPGYESSENESYITLTTHNAKADTINQNQLDKLSNQLCEYKAEITGDFNERAYPADLVLQLKEGSQIMFIKNDKGESRRFFNGKIATISRISGEEVYVRFEGDEHDMLLEKETWRSIRYQYNNEEDKIEEEEVGSFKQYPVRLAWAITIHKSQGLTFEKAIIDAGASFAPGQVYVALSRLTSLAGLVLYSRIHPTSINTDTRVIEFTRLEQEEDQLAQELQQEQQLFITRSLVQTFDWLKLAEGMQMHYDDYEKRTIPDKNACIVWAKQLLEAVLKQTEMADKFTRQLEQLLPNATQDGYQFLHQRVSAGSTYFLKAMEEMETAVTNHIAEIKPKPKAKKYVSTLQQLLLLPQRKKELLQQAVLITEGLVKGANATDLLQLVEDQKRADHIKTVEEVEKKTNKVQKGDSNRISLQLFKEGKDIAEIATIRELAPSTIETHLASFVRSGELDIKELVPENKITVILQAVAELNLQNVTTTPIKEKLGDAFSYSEIRAVLYHREWLQVSKAAN
ncbi:MULTISPECIES: helix-turn-helix domain-containing protein [Niastella]|uniref:Helix-turn-helix domain-containing protein n=1 Tax=Niastella soli TaxID=2821487 RepID=A0ABS3YQG3_9BACT|nr:helix-turn-helix domain-containing protein [Niastella soli]MBO9199675.1 helix-turn-helix domain-containing protein [Niastella soli]